jgi:hypothetical protein
MNIPSGNKNQVTRSRGGTFGEAGGDEPFGTEPKPMLDEHRQGGLRGEDKRQSAMVDAAPRGLSGDETSGEQRTPHEDAQPGADVRAPLVRSEDTLPEGLLRERTHPLNPSEGRGGPVPAHIPSGKR